MKNHSRRSILCPNCRRLISRDETRCPHCGMTNPGAWWKNTPVTRGFGSGGDLLRTIIYVNIGMYILSVLLYPRGPGAGMNPLALFAPANESLFLLGATGTVPIDRLGRWWSVISANYLHGGLLHIFFNMIALRQLAPFVLQEYGAYRMFAIYTLGGVIGFGVSYLAGVAYTIGASAAICALIGAILYYSRHRGGAYGQAVFSQVAGWTLGLLLIGFLVPGINNWGHGGGIAGGALLGLLLGYREQRPENFFHRLLAGACFLATAGVLAFALIFALYYRLAG